MRCCAICFIRWICRHGSSSHSHLHGTFGNLIEFGSSIKYAASLIRPINLSPLAFSSLVLFAFLTLTNHVESFIRDYIFQEGYECQCCSGFVGPHCEEQDACYPSPCKNNGICVDISQGHEGSTFQCLCPYGECT